MSVHRTEISDIHALKDILLIAKSRLQGVIKSQYLLLATIIEHALAIEPLCGFKAQFIVCSIGVELQEIFLHTSHSMVYTHVIVIEHDEHIIWRARHIIESLESQTATHGAVAYHGHHISLATAHLGSHSHAKCCRDAIGSMTAGKSVILAF